jgi:hypothetical protein
MPSKSVDLEKDFIPDLLRVAETLGKSPNVEEYRYYGKYSASVSAKWGKWKDLLKKAGLGPVKRRTREEVALANLSNGMCVRHVKVKAEVGQLCLDCWFIVETATNLGDSKRWQEVKALFFANNSSCVYTGVKLIPGINAWLDHIIPVSKGGPLILENIQWVDADVNKMKYNRTHDEFLEFCKIIKRYRKNTQKTSPA